MTAKERDEKIADCKARRKRYTEMLKYLDDYRIAITRSVAAENFNIKYYKTMKVEE